MRFWITDRTYDDFFNSDPWPLPGRPEAMKMSCCRGYFHTRLEYSRKLGLISPEDGFLSQEYSGRRSRSCEESAIASPSYKLWSCHNARACG